jgi:archaeosortase A (PGF-CTERM-specific)
MLLFASVLLLGAGFLHKKNKCHIIRAAGWVAFGIYWYWQFPFWLAKGETLNMLGTIGALPVFLYLGYHEYLSWKWKDEYEPLRFLAGACFFASAIYFVIETVPAISSVIISAVADQTSSLINMFTGAGYHVTSIDLNGNSPWYMTTENDVTAHLAYRGGESSVSIILPCTGIQAIAAAFAFLVSVRASRRIRLKAVLVIIPTIYIVNLFRNAFVVYAADSMMFGDATMDIAHGIIGKFLITMTTLVVLLVVAFMIVPEFYDCLNGVFDLPWRRAPGHDYKKFIGRLLGGAGDGRRKKGGPKGGAQAGSRVIDTRYSNSGASEDSLRKNEGKNPDGSENKGGAESDRRR